MSNNDKQRSTKTTVASINELFGGKKILFASLLTAVTALVVYVSTLATYVFPGESAKLFSQWTGVEPLEFPVHPVWGAIVRLFAELPGGVSPVMKVNLLSLVCGIVTSAMIVPLVAFYVRRCIRQEDCVRHIDAAGLIAGVVSGLSFVFATAVWQASTHLDYNMFDVAFVVALFYIFPMIYRKPSFAVPLTIVLGLLVGVGLVESAIFFPLLVVYFILLLVTLSQTGNKLYFPSGLFLVAAIVGYSVVSVNVFSAFAITPVAKMAGFDSAFEVFTSSLARQSRDMGLWFSRSGWLYVQIFAVLPFIACAFGAKKGLNNDRSWSQYLFHAGMTICTIISLATPLSAEGIMRPYGILPVATTTLSVIVAGYLVVYWYLLIVAKPTLSDGKEESSVSKIGSYIAPAAGGIFAAVLLFTVLINAFSCTRNRGAFADKFANAILDRLDGRTWFVTDGLIDEHLRVAAASRGMELNLVCLQRDMDDSYLKQLAQLVEKKKLVSESVNLGLSVELGVLPFLQDWFNADSNVVNSVAIFGVPDIWYMAGKTPVPRTLFFGGAHEATGFDALAAKADFDAFWKEFADDIPPEGRGGSYSIGRISDPTTRLRLQIRRHIGFVANNLAVCLQDQGHDKEAFELYELILKTIDPDNVSALFNEFEMARRKVPVAVTHRQEIERALKAIVDDPNRRYLLWSLSRYYGYIRSPEVFARMGFTWARSGQMGNAIAHVQRAIDFVPADRQTGLLNMMAAIYAGGNKKQESREIYQKVLAQDSENKEALMGLTRLALQDGALDKAREYLTRAVNVSKEKDGAGVEFALLSLINNDIKSARLSLQKMTDMQPKSLQAWSLLAGVMLQQFDQSSDAAAKGKIMDELENVIMPRMESIASSPHDYFVQMTRALILMRKGPSFRKSARDALVVASMSRPDVTVAGDMILNLDISLDDGASAEKHARQILRRNRHDKLANYVMGSLRLKDGDYSTAETFLRLSVNEERPIAAAQNDLAEVLRRVQKYSEAEKYARAAIAAQPELYVAWETLGSTLLDQNKGLDEAEVSVKKAIDLGRAHNSVEDLRMLITLARVQLAKRDFTHLRGTLRTLKSKQHELSAYDRSVLEKLLQAADRGNK